MSVVAEFSIPAGTFGLGRLLAGGDEVGIELERLVPTGNEVMPYFWARIPGRGFEAFEREVREDPLVSGLEVVDRLDDETLYAIEWKRIPESLVRGIARTGGAILEGRGSNGRWRFVIRFPDQARLTAFNDFLEDHGIDIEVHRVYTKSERGRERAFDLTGEQREAIVSAVRRGYFEVPRGVTLGDLAEELGITSQAASERVRRGANAVLRGALLESGEFTATGGPEERFE